MSPDVKVVTDLHMPFCLRQNDTTVDFTAIRVNSHGSQCNIIVAAVLLRRETLIHSVVMANI